MAENKKKIESVAENAPVVNEDLQTCYCFYNFSSIY